jgi:hypothetical protein
MQDDVCAEYSDPLISGTMARLFRVHSVERNRADRDI